MDEQGTTIYGSDEHFPVAIGVNFQGGHCRGIICAGIILDDVDVHRYGKRKNGGVCTIEGWVKVDDL